MDSTSVASRVWCESRKISLTLVLRRTVTPYTFSPLCPSLPSVCRKAFSCALPLSSPSLPRSRNFPLPHPLSFTLSLTHRDIYIHNQYVVLFFARKRYQTSLYPPQTPCDHARDEKVVEGSPQGKYCYLDIVRGLSRATIVLSQGNI